MRKTTIVRVIGVALCIAAAAICQLLLTKHVTGSSGAGWFEAGCGTSDEGAPSSCAVVLASPYGYFPPRRPDEAPNTPHIPVAFLGLVYYSVLGVWLIGIGRPSRSRWWVHLAPLLFVLCGLAISARFVYLMYAVIDERCPWCVVTHGLNLLIGVCLVLLWPTRRGEAGRHQQGEAGVADSTHPSWMRLAGTLGVMAVVAYGDYGQSSLLASRRTQTTLNQCMAAVSRIRSDEQKLFRNWEMAEPKNITLRPDDPMRARASVDQSTLPMVVFSDLECPACIGLARFIEERVQPLFAGRLKIIFKHYPLDAQCNPRIGKTVHPNACAKAELAEAARMQEGNDGFWRVHDYFVHETSAAQGAPFDATSLAAQLGLDAKRAAADMSSSVVASRVNADIELAKSVGITGTPTVFVANRLVDPLARSEIAFWDKVADLFWREVGEQRPPSTRLTHAANAHAAATTP